MPRRRPSSSASTGASGSAVQPCPTGPPWPTSPPARSETITPDDYIRMWEAKNCRKMTPAEKGTLARGCIGITAVELGTSGNPPLDNCYATFDQAKKRSKEMERECARRGKAPMIFSKRFYSDGQAYTPDPATGKVNMVGYRYRAKPKPSGGTYVNFDYGFYDPTSDSWWHANHKEPGMKVYRSTREHYSRPLADFDQQVYGVACGGR